MKAVQPGEGVLAALIDGLKLAWSRPRAALLGGFAVALYGGAQLVAVVGASLLTWPGPPSASGAPHTYLLKLVFVGAPIWLVVSILPAVVAVFARRLVVRDDEPQFWPGVWRLVVWLWLPLVLGYPAGYYADYVLPFRNLLPGPTGMGNAVATALLLGAGFGALMARVGSAAWPGPFRMRSHRWSRVALGALAGLALGATLPLAVLFAYLVNEPYRTPVMLAGMLPYCLLVGATIIGTTAHTAGAQRFARPVGGLRS